tara:strand:- start:3230 stop:3436 length:207 start_codon:yes stop_codon:yes gene_type:complete
MGGALVSDYRVFMKTLKGRTRVIALTGCGTVEDTMQYVKEHRKDLEDAIGAPLKAKSPVLIEIVGGKS